MFLWILSGTLRKKRPPPWSSHYTLYTTDKQGWVTCLGSTMCTMYMMVVFYRANIAHMVAHMLQTQTPYQEIISRTICHIRWATPQPWQHDVLWWSRSREHHVILRETVFMRMVKQYCQKTDGEHKLFRPQGSILDRSIFSIRHYIRTL